MRLSTKNRVLLAAAAAALPVVALGAAGAVASPISNASPAFTHGFQAYTGAGFAPSPSAGQLDSDDVIVTGLSDGSLAFGGTGTTGDFARGTAAGSVTTGGIYALSVAGDVMFLAQPTDLDFSPGSLVFRFTNTGTTNITGVTLTSALYLRNDGGRANSFDAHFSTSDTFAAFTTLDAYTSPEAIGNTAMVAVPGEGGGSVGSLAIAPGSSFYIRYLGNDVSGSGARDEFGLGSMTVTATFAPVPEPASASLLALAGLAALRRRRA